MHLGCGGQVLPAAGTLVLMRSDRVPHEVLETKQPRRCIVGWLRGFREARSSQYGGRNSDENPA